MVFLAIIGFPSNVNTSTDGGVTWLEHTPLAFRNWRGISSSSDGSRLTVVANPGNIYTSENGGATWTEHSGLGVEGWEGIASSSDGLRLAAAASEGHLYTSSDGGATWVQQTGAGERRWRSIASSSDGLTLFAYDSASSIVYRSLDGGVNWTRFLKRRLRSLSTKSGGSLLGCEEAALGLLFSSALDTFTGLQGDSDLQLIYLGNGVFGRR